MSSQCTLPIRKIGHSFFFHPCDGNKIISIVTQIKNKKRVGCDGISILILKTAKHSIAEPLAYLINKSVETGVFPDHLKIGKVIPVHKKMKKVVPIIIDQ